MSRLRRGAPTVAFTGRRELVARAAPVLDCGAVGTFRASLLVASLGAIALGCETPVASGGYVDPDASVAKDVVTEDVASKDVAPAEDRGAPADISAPEDVPVAMDVLVAVDVPLVEDVAPQDVVTPPQDVPAADTGPRCGPGQMLCGDACVETMTSAAHCGACGRACAVPNATPRCTAGVCGIGSCATGFADCDRGAANGCEVNANTDVGNCGACGTRCSFPNGAAACIGGRCALSACNTGFANCNAMSADGCETNLQANVQHCGRCGNACIAPAGRTPVCVAGVCDSVAGICPRGTADCDGNAANGCETNTLSSATSCGGCGISCARANATSTCSSGVCTAPVCTSPFLNCDANGANGCEVSPTTDVTNCGSCGNYCRMVPGVGTASCTAGQCTPTCAAGYGNCDGNALNGCEASLNTITNCGRCGSVCPSGRTCQNGTCGVFPVVLRSYSPVRFTITPPAFISACTAPGRAVILPNLDDSAQLFAMPFAFSFWNTSYAAGAMINVATNGWLSFDPVVRNNLRALMPDPAVPNAVIAPFMTDLVTGPGGICLATLGTAPSRMLVIEWPDAVFFRDRASRLRFEAILFEASGQVNFYYDTLGPVPAGENVTVGVEHQNGQTAAVNCNGANPCPITTGARIGWALN